MADFTITRTTDDYQATNSVGGVVASAETLETVMMTMEGLVSAGQSLALVGNDLVLTNTVAMNKGLTYNLTQATITVTGSFNVFAIGGGNGYIFSGGHIIGPNSSSAGIVFRCVNCSSVAIAGTMIEKFTGTDLGGAVVFGYGSTKMKLTNVTFNSYGKGGVTLVNEGNNEITYCKFSDVSNGIFAGDCGHNKILHNEFENWHVSMGHAIYIDGSGANTGYNEIAHNDFHNGANGAALHIKCEENDIYDNDFRDMGSGAVAFSIYSEHSGYAANNNKIHDNRFNNCYFGFWIGHNADAEPTVGNKIYSNIFTNITKCIMPSPFEGGINYVDDTWIYYNTFINCGQVFWSSGTNNLIRNTVVAYNDFSQSQPSLLVLKGYVNSMVYGNTGLDDYNVPTTPPIPPPSQPPSPPPTASLIAPIILSSALAYGLAKLIGIA
jgi:parallel beta-helix repeat protein